ncbi:hypothetical protein [Streptomyces sp. NPDC048350]|uniref:hypothetical protein n=1 Tax=Streptomyces sp. NPDC048350 TaxID=3365538 RepID=UPI0037171D35
MSNTRVPKLVADTMAREGLSEAGTVLDVDANNAAVTVTLLGFSVRNRAGRFDFVEVDGTLHPRGYKSSGPVTSWARKRAAEAAAVDVIPDPVADAQEVQDAAEAEAFRIKATKAHDRVVKGHKRVMAAHERAHAAQTRAEDARERAMEAEAAESERAYVRVAEADALMWTHTPRTAEYRGAFGAFVSARFDAERLPVSEACEEVHTYAEAAEAAAGAEYENGGGKDVPGADQCAEDADHARKETMIEYGAFERGTPAGRFDAETACDLICLHARDMAAAVRHAEAAAKAAEAAADQAEAWADAAEEQTNTAEYETDALFTLGADCTQRALSRAYWDVSGVVAEAASEAAETAAEAAERRARVAAAEAATAEERSAERPAEREAVQRAAECADAAAEAETHSARASEAYQITRDLMMHPWHAYAPRPVDRLPEAEAAEARALLRRIDRRSIVAHDVDCAARRDWYDGSPVTDPQRARDCANRARMLADGCEADARRVAELFAWAEYAERVEAEAEPADTEEEAEAPARVATGPKVVPLAECIARAEAEAARLDAVARELHAWAVDMRDLLGDVINGRSVLGTDPADARDWAHRSAEMAASASAAASKARWEAQRWASDAERSEADKEATRARTARLFSGEGDGRSRWASADGRSVIALALPADDDALSDTDSRYAELLAGALTAKDSRRVLKPTDVPNKKTHGRGPGAEFKQAVARASRPLVQPWKAPRIPAAGKPLDGAALAVLDAEGVCAEVEAAPGVWLPRAAVYVAETAAANGWAVAMERHAPGAVIVRAAGVLARESGPVAGEIIAVWTDGMCDVRRSGAYVGGRRLDGAAELERVLTTIGQSAEAGDIATSGAPKEGSAPAPEGVSDPGGADAWETDGGACPGVELLGTLVAGRGIASVGIALSPEIGTCTVRVVGGARKLPDVGSDPEAVDTWDGEVGAVSGVETPHVRPARNLRDEDPYVVRPAVAEWTPVPGTTRRTAELNCAGKAYRVFHAPDAVLPYTVRGSLGGADVDLGGWVGMDDVRAIVRADRRRTATLEAHRLHIERQQRRAAHRLEGERQQTPVRLTEEGRRAIARRAEERHRPEAAELYVSPITGSAVLAFVCGTCAAAHEDVLWRPQRIGGRYRTPLSVGRDVLAALVEKQGWIVPGPWTAYGTRGDTMRALIAPTPAYLAWVDAHYGPDPEGPDVGPGERITPVQRGWWEVVSKEGHRYGLTWRPTLTGAVWRVRHQTVDGGELVAETGLASTGLTGLRVQSAECGSQPAGTMLRQPVHVLVA